MENNHHVKSVSMQGIWQTPSPEQTYGVGHMLMVFLSVDVTGAQRGKAGLLRAHRQDLNTFLSDSKATGLHYLELRDATFRLPLPGAV